MMQTGDRLTYRPQQAGEQLTRYRTALTQVIAKVNELAKQPSETDIETLAQRFHLDPNSEEAQKKVADYRSRVACALAALADVPSPPL
jgi:ABC-type Fe3+-hydroxamate transport system substrate-binding protein